MDWFAFGPRASNGSIDGAPSDKWSASERALRVSQSDTLQALLNAEIHKSGFLTSAGHRAVVQNFLHSDAVDEEMARARDEEMTKARDAKPQEGLFRRLVSSDGSMASGTKGTNSLFRRLASSGSTTSNTGTANSLFRRLDSSDSTASIIGSVDSSRARRRGSRGVSSALRRFSADLSMEIDFDPCEARDGDDDASDRGGWNIAPRRASHQRLLPSPAQDGKVEDETMGSGQLPRPLIVKTKPPAHCEDEPAPSRPDESRRSADGSHDEVLDSLRRTYGSWRRSCDGSLDTRYGSWRRSFGSEDLTQSVRSDDDSCADECGWLPWPSEGEGDAPDDDVHMVSMENMQLQED